MTGLGFWMTAGFSWERPWPEVRVLSKGPLLALSSCPDRPFQTSLCLGESALPRGPAGGLLTGSALGQRDKARATTWPQTPLGVPSAAFCLSGVSDPIQVHGDNGSPYEQGKVLEESLGRMPRLFWILRAITF